MEVLGKRSKGKGYTLFLSFLKVHFTQNTFVKYISHKTYFFTQKNCIVIKIIIMACMNNKY